MAKAPLGTVLALLLCSAAAAQQTADLTARLLDPFAFRHIGPIGNRVSAVAGVPGDEGVYYAGAASGGLWRTHNGGIDWEPIFDRQEAASIGSIAVAPSDPNVVWVGTGESFIRSNISIGNGVYRSTDRGDSFEHLGLDQTGRIGRIVVHPDDPDTALIAALGHAYGPQERDEAGRGVFRTTDGGATWDHVLFIDANTGAIDLAFAPDNPRTVYAAAWQIEIRTSGRTSGGPGSGLHRSRDGGATWEPLEDAGLPAPPLGKIGLAVSADDPDRLYALIETSSNRDFAPSDPFAGVLWRSDDRGDSWRLVSRNLDLITRPLYYTRMAAAPDRADEVTFVATRLSLSLDGGSTVESEGFDQAGWDHHDIWIDPLDPDRRIVGHDGGVSITSDRGHSWYRPQLPIAQMYHVSTDDRVPYFVYSNRQDGPSMRGPSRALYGGRTQGIPVGEWHSVGGCEVGFSMVDRADPDLVWTGCYDGQLELYDLRSGQARDVSVWPLAIESSPASALEYRFQWTAPFATSPHDEGRGLRRQPVRSPQPRPRPELGAHLAGPDHRRPRPDAPHRRPDPRRRRPDRCAGGVRDRREPGRTRSDLGGHERRPGPVDPRRRRDLDQREREPPGPAAPGHGAQHRPLALRGRHGLRRDRPAPGGRHDPLRLPHQRLRRDLDRPRRRSAPRPARQRPLHP